MVKKKSDYLSYLIRLWRVNREGKAKWRASLENPITSERQDFASLAEVMAFLEKEIEARKRDDEQTIQD